MSGPEDPEWWDDALSDDDDEWDMADQDGIDLSPDDFDDFDGDYSGDWPDDWFEPGEWEDVGPEFDDEEWSAHG